MAVVGGGGEGGVYVGEVGVERGGGEVAGVRPSFGPMANGPVAVATPFRVGPLTWVCSRSC